jgi:hypothetical protein
LIHETTSNATQQAMPRDVTNLGNLLMPPSHPDIDHAHMGQLYPVPCRPQPAESGERDLRAHVATPGQYCLADGAAPAGSRPADWRHVVGEQVAYRLPGGCEGMVIKRK